MFKDQVFKTLLNLVSWSFTFEDNDWEYAIMALVYQKLQSEEGRAGYLPGKKTCFLCNEHRNNFVLRFPLKTHSD